MDPLEARGTGDGELSNVGACNRIRTSARAVCCATSLAPGFCHFFLNIPPCPSQQSGAELCISQDCSTQQKEKKKPIVNLTFPSANNISLSQYEESHCWKHTASEPSERTLNGRKNTRMGAWRHPGRMLSWCSANSIWQDRLQQSRPL